MVLQHLKHSEYELKNQHRETIRRIEDVRVQVQFVLRNILYLGIYS
jgi:hypothetical protein